MEKFCYWQEEIPHFTNVNFLINKQKICLFRQAEYKLNGKISIFCPFTKENKQECSEYKVSEQFYGENSK